MEKRTKAKEQQSYIVSIPHKFKRDAIWTTGGVSLCRIFFLAYLLLQN